MKVIIVGNTTPPDKMGGLGRYTRELAGALVAAGCDVKLLVKRVDPRSPSRERTFDGVDLIRHDVLDKRNPLFAPTYPFLTARGVLGPLRTLADEQTIIHTHFPVTALPIALSGRRFIHTFHAPVWEELLDERQASYFLPTPVQGLAVTGIRGAERQVMNRAREVFVLSDFMRRRLHEISPHAADRALVLPGGIDTGRFAPQTTTERAPTSAPRLFTARRMSPRMGLDVLIAAMPTVLAHHPSATLAIAGTGEMEGLLRSMSTTLGIAGRIEFLGRISDQELVMEYCRATLAVMPTTKLEGFGLTTAEALACGTPVVGTAVGATPEILAPISRALLAPTATAPALASTIIALLDDPAKLRRIADVARRRVAPEMDWTTIAARYIEVYAGHLNPMAVR
jgi:glycosyltransferase involved in cell wall biosynthesis